VKPFSSRDRVLIGLPMTRRRKAGGLARVLVVASALILLYLAWPYVTLWRVEHALRSDDMAALNDLVDLESVRAEIKKKLNKDADSTIGELSDAFIRWLEEGIGVMGNQAVDRLVTIDWVRGRLLAYSSDDGEGFLGQVTYAFFDAANGFIVRIGPASGDPVRLRFSLQGLKWRVSALYY
jgi:hypothetical protein